VKRSCSGEGEDMILVVMGSGKKIHVKTNGRYLVIDPSEIYCCKADGSYTPILLEGDEKVVVSRSLKEVSKDLPETRFCRCHHSCIVNLEKVKSYNKKELKLTNGMTLPVSRRRYHELVRMIKKKRQ